MLYVRSRIQVLDNAVMIRLISELVGCFFSKDCYVFDKILRSRNPGNDLIFAKADKIDIVSLLAPLKKIVVDSCQVFGNPAGFDIILVEKTANTGVFGGR